MAAGNDFVGKLFKAINKNLKKDENVFFSPLSISLTMSMVLHGAEGESRSQLMKALGFTNKVDILREQKRLLCSLNVSKKDYSRFEQPRHEGDENVKLEIANKVYMDKKFSIHQKFIDQLKEGLDCELQKLDFVAEPEDSRIKINEWVEAKTDNKIKDLISEGVINDQTRLMLVNAICFKGRWAVEFEKYKTQALDFYCLDGSVREVDMMHEVDNYGYYYDENLKVQCLIIPYKGRRYSMCLFLPDARDGLREMEESLTSDLMRSMVHQCRRQGNVNLGLPKFSLEYGCGLNNALRELGIVEIFSPDSANLKGISDDVIYVTDVHHKAFIEVNEKGTEAWAATRLCLGGGGSCDYVVPDVICDHPFIFTINCSHEVLFFGKVACIQKKE